MTPPTEKLLFVAMDDDKRAHLTWCDDENAVRQAVRNAMYFGTAELTDEGMEEVAGITEDLIEGGVYTCEGDSPLYLYRVPHPAACPTDDAIIAALAASGVKFQWVGFDRQVRTTCGSIDEAKIIAGVRSLLGAAPKADDIDFSIKRGDVVENERWTLTPLIVEDVNWALRAVALRLGHNGGLVVWPANGLRKVGAMPLAAAATLPPITGHDLSTSAGATAYLVEYFATRLRTHTYQRYIEERLAKDFACALALHLSERDAAPVAPERRTERLTDRQRHALEHAIGLVKREGVSNQHVINLQILLDKDARASKTHCAARNGGAPGSEPQDCDWPGCGCDEAAMKVIEALQESGNLATTRAAADVLRERDRQCSVENFTPAQDDRYQDGSLVGAAVCYSIASFGTSGYRDMSIPNYYWPPTWSERWWKPTTPRRNLVKAAALLLAEIERIDRRGTQSNPGVAAK